MSNVMKIISVLVLCILMNMCTWKVMAMEKADQGNVYKQDYLQACKLIANNYIYLELKLGISGTEFYEQCVDYANTIDWSSGKTRFIQEIRKLCSRFPDGHFDWQIDQKLYRADDNYFLGFIMTVGKNNPFM